MKPIQFLFLVVIATLILSCQAPKQDRPNVILIYADDLGYGDLSCYGGEIPTPNIDKLSDYGVRHTNAYATASTCTPSRYSLMTGQYAWREAGRGVVDGDAKALIPKGKQTVASVFKEAGYSTAVVGKWHLGLGDSKGINWNGQIANTPNDVGFDKSFIIAATADRVPCVYIKDREVLNLDPADPLQVNYHHKIGDLPTGKENPELLKVKYSHGHDKTIINGISRIGYQAGGKNASWQDENLADDFVREAKQFIINQKEKPFFLYLATNNIHVPRMPHARFQGKTEQGLRGDAIVELDDMVAQVVHTLDSLQLAERTIIIFSSDNGAVLDDGYDDKAVELNGEHRPFANLRGGKYSAYQGGTKIPMIVSWRGKLAKQTSNALISQVDFIGSVAQLVGIEADQSQAVDTQPQWEAWIGNDTKGRSYVVQEAIRNVLSVVKYDYKYIEPTEHKIQQAWQTGIETGFQNYPQLYHLTSDPSERHNVAYDNPKRVEQMQEILNKEREKGEMK